MATMSERIYNKRKEYHLTMEELGSRVGVGKSTIHKWENGHTDNIKRSNIAALAKELHCSPLWLMGISEEEQSSDSTATIAFKDEQDKEYFQMLKKIMEDETKKKMLAAFIRGLCIED